MAVRKDPAPDDQAGWDQQIRKHANAARSQFALKDSGIAFTPNNQYEKSVLRTEVKAFTDGMNKKLDEMKLTDAQKAEFKPILQSLDQEAKNQFERWKSNIEPGAVQGQMQTIVNLSKKALDDKFAELKVADEKKAGEIKAAKDEADAKLEAFNKKVLNDQMYELNRSFQSQASVQLTEQLHQESLANKPQPENRPPRTWFIITDALEKKKIEEEEKNGNKDPHAVLNAENQGEEQIDGIYESKETNVRIFIQGGNFKPIPPPETDSEFRECYREVLRFMKEQRGIDRITYDNKHIDLNRLNIMIEEAQSMNMSIRLGPNAMMAMSNLHKSPWDNNIFHRIGVAAVAKWDELGKQVADKLNGSLKGKVLLTIGRGVGKLLDVTLGNVCRFVGLSLDPKAHEVIEAIKKCEANYIKHTENTSKQPANEKVANAVIAKLDKDPAMKVLSEPALNLSASAEDIQKRVTELKAAREKLNIELQMRIEQEIAVNPGNKSLTKLADKYKEGVTKLDESLTALAKLANAAGNDDLKKEQDQVKEMKEVVNGKAEVKGADNKVTEAAQPSLAERIGTANKEAEEARQKQIEKKESIFELPAQKETKKEGESQEPEQKSPGLNRR